MSGARERARTTRLGVLATIFLKDLKLFGRDWLFLALTTASVVIFVALYYVLPAEVEPAFRLGVRGTQLRDAIEELAGGEDEGVPLEFFERADALRAAVETGELDAGIDFPDTLAGDVRGGVPVTVTVFVRPTLAPEYSGAVSTMVREIAFAIAGYELPVAEPSQERVVLGPDSGPVPMRDRMRPLYAFMVLIMEAVALGTLIASEVQQRTLVAVLATPARVSDVLLSKGALGTLLAFTESAIVLLLIRGFGPTPGLVAAALFLGAILVTGVAMIAGSAGKDLVGTMLNGMVILLPLAVPAFAVLFPGSPGFWVRIIPSYGLVRAVLDASVNGFGWVESLPELGMLAAWCVVIAGLGVVVLRRRMGGV